MASINEAEADRETRALRRRIAELETKLELAISRAFPSDGSRPLSGPLQHTGSTVGFFNVAPQQRGPTPTTLADVIATLQRYGLVP